jgi:hypothetical protein
MNIVAGNDSSLHNGGNRTSVFALIRQTTMNLFDADTLEQHVRDCLLHLYDYMFLQEHPLVLVCVPNAKGEASRVQLFRQVITTAIESLNSGPELDTNSRDARIYHILHMRYIGQKQIQYILHYLNLSERQFYRDHAKAVQALSRVLNEQIKAPLISPAVTMSIQSEVERVHNQDEPQQVNSRAFVEKTLSTLQALADRHQARITLNVPETPLALNTNRTVLRQALIWIMSRLITQSPPRSLFKLSLDVLPSYCRFTLERTDTTVDLEPIHFPDDQAETLSTLVSALDGTIKQEAHPGQGVQIILDIPLILLMTTRTQLPFFGVIWRIGLTNCSRLMIVISRLNWQSRHSPP